MAVLWKAGPSTVTEVRCLLKDALAYTTVLTILRTLEAKGYVSHSLEGRAHRYEACVDSDLARRSALHALLRKLFDGSPDLLLRYLIRDRNLRGSRLTLIRQILNDSDAQRS